MGVWGDIGKELGKAVITGAIQGAAQAMQQNNQNFARSNNNYNNNYNNNNDSALIQAANNGDIDAIEEVAARYFLQVDYQNAIYWARQGAQSNSSVCLFILGEIAFTQNDFYAAEQFFMRNVNVNSHIDSANELGFLYLRDDTGMQDIEKAFYYFNFVLQQDQNQPEAAYGIALCLIEADTPDVNLVENLLRVATNSENATIRNEAQQILREIRNNRNNPPPQNNDGCFITTAVCENFNKPDDCFELTAFRNFRDNWLMNQVDGKNLISEYYSIAPKIVASINKFADSEEIYKNIWNKYLEPCLEFIKSGDNFSCKNKYIEMVRDLKNLYL